MTPARRFWTDVTIEAREIRLDGRPLRTPARAALVLPTAELADAVAVEWRTIGETIDPRVMPLTGLANAAIDRVAPDRERFARTIAAYAESDLLCYRAEVPAALVERQSAAWDPPLRWVERRYGVQFFVTQGIVHVAQPSATVARMNEVVSDHDVFRLAALQQLTTLSGSLVLALAVADDAVDIDAAWAAAEVDEIWQAERWGEDSLATEARAARETAFRGAARMMSLL